MRGSALREWFDSAPQLLSVIADLLGHPRAERRAAAAIVLGEIEAAQEEILEKLRVATRRTDDAVLRRWAAEAIGTIAPKSIVQDLQPLLKDPDRLVRETVSRALATGKGVKTEDIARMLGGGDDKERLAAIVVLGAMETRSARKTLLELLPTAKGRVMDAVIDALRSGLLAVSGPDAVEASEDIEAVIEPKQMTGDPDFGIAIVQLLGYVSHEVSAEALLGIARSSASPEVKGSAIETLRRVIKGKTGHDKFYKGLLEVAEDAALPQAVLIPATEVLASLEVPLELEPRVRALIASTSSTVRRFALRALGDLDATPPARALAKVVEAGDPAERELALESALKTASGREELARLLGRIKDEGRARSIANGLRPFGQEIKQGVRHLLEEAVIEAPGEVARAILDLIKHAGADSGSSKQGSLFDRALKHKKKNQFSEAIAILRNLCHGADADPEARFQLGVLELKISKRSIGRGPSADPCIGTFAALLRSRDFPIVERLKTEKLDPEELYFLGFSLAEGSDAEQGLGCDILAYLSEMSPSTKLGKMAKNKLATMGWEE